eukprot:TRINITY_DN6152_c0_g1_i1.p1 TRINITY_DN6152_c0_g1~~TRINITY_DN6152_c0_g1_i1.p1  ORF type:complete len:445 (-),score=119.87 TRINITY_DN6152_c0_g1_i1:115-1449(-)
MSDKPPKDLTGDQGVLKKIIKEGTGFEKPSKGYDVQVHYVGKLTDGTVFDSSRDRGTPFEFKLGEGQVIKGWDEGVKTMKKGEICTLTIAPQYGYGEAGSPPKIPPNSTLVFEIELLSFSNEKDISKKKDGSIVKKTLVEAEGYETPKDETECKVHLVGKLVDGKQFEDRSLTFRIGDGSVCPGLDIALKSMKKGEKAEIKIQPQHGYGEKGNQELSIPPNATLHYQVHLEDFTKEKESWEIDSFDEKYAIALQKKEQGNELFKSGHFKRAVAQYKKAIDFIDYDHDLKDEEKEKSKNLKTIIYNNISMVYVKKQKFGKVMENCKKVLDVEPNNAKALFRRGLSYASLDSWDLAKKDFLHVLSLEKDNKLAKTELAKVNEKIKQQNEKDKKRFKNLFGRLAKLEEKEKSDVTPVDKMEVDQGNVQDHEKVTAQEKGQDHEKAQS